MDIAYTNCIQHSHNNNLSMSCLLFAGSWSCLALPV